MANYTTAEIKTYIRDAVREAKGQARVDTGFLKRSIRGDYDAKSDTAEFSQMFYGIYNGNSKLEDIVARVLPKDLPYKIFLENEDGGETLVRGRSASGRTLKSTIPKVENGKVKIANETTRESIPNRTVNRTKPKSGGDLLANLLSGTLIGKKILNKLSGKKDSDTDED